MRHGVVSVPENALLDSVRQAMADHHVHAILVRERSTGRPLGWVRAEALLTWINLESDPVHAHRAITEPVVTIAPDAPLRGAVSALSRHGISHLLVCGEDDHAAEGVVTALDVVTAWER
jgi:signal-transduction protein with cAMP-binding, CBS, and nucleotidyltransferase domain